MLDHATEAVELTHELTRGDLEEQRLLQLALVRLVEIVGEAAGRVSKETQEHHPEIPWAQIVSMRNPSLPASLRKSSDSRTTTWLSVAAG